MTLKTNAPAQANYDVVIIGGAMLGSSVAAHLAMDKGFGGSVLVVERDPSYEFSSTAHTNSCVRQQFSNEINIRISQYTADLLRDFPAAIGRPDAPQLPIEAYGYLYLADNDGFAQVLRDNHKVQAACGAGTRLMSADEIKAAYPFYNVDDVVLGSHNLVDEGYWEGGSVFDWFRRIARDGGAEYVANEVTAITRVGDRVTSVTLKSGEVVGCGAVVNATGPRAAQTAAMLGFALPVEPRKRYTYIFACDSDLGSKLPLTIDPSGVHMRTDGTNFLAGCPPDDDPAVEPDDFVEDHSLWEEKVWPILATRVPQFERIKLLRTWVGHYAYNAMDQNAVVGPHPEVSNFIFLNGFSGHGLQQAPAMGRGAAELVTHGAYQTLDLTPFGYDRILDGRKFLETAVI